MVELEHSDVRLDTQPRFPVLERIAHGATIYALQTIGKLVYWYWGWTSPPEIPPNIVKCYRCRPSLKVSIFFPKSYDSNASKALLPTVFTIHGGGFCIGQPQDDEAWNARFANMHNVLVVSLDYRKAPSYPFPTALHDVEALLLAAFDDESLPIDKSRVAVAGFSAGGNLALTACQLPSIREKVKPLAVVPIYAVVDQSLRADVKIKTRYYKPGLGPGLRSSPTDFLIKMVPMFTWSYLDPGRNLKDPLISPYFAPRDVLPPHIFFVSTELDQLAHETWCMANKLARRPEPPLSEKVGQEKPAAGKGELILDDERFAFEHIGEGGKTSIRWLLVPDQIHGFEHLPRLYFGAEEAFEDAKLKEIAYQKLMGQWLREVAWK
ncbi:alpha/beta-hydrolase [Hypoxylon sp. FL0543]|nr:alpha/beta-hydrolase [Hypoxylon sp. FL0543]